MALPENFDGSPLVMKAYAIVKNGVAVQIGETSGALPAGAVAIDSTTSVALGAGYSNGTWQEGALSAPRHITKLAFRRRFTQAERVSLKMASLDNPAASTPARQQAATLCDYLDDVSSALYIDLDRTDTRAGVQALESLGLLASGRALAILDATIQPAERP